MDARAFTKIARNMLLYKNSVNKDESMLNATEYEMLRYITKREERCLSEIVEYLNVNKSLVTRMSKHLESLGYVTISTSSVDSRKKLIKATPRALEIKSEAVDEENFFYDKCLDVLNEEERKTLLELLDKVYLESKRLRKSNFKELK